MTILMYNIMITHHIIGNTAGILLLEQQCGEERTRVCLSRIIRPRLSWVEFMETTSPLMFRRYFRMSKQDFNLLCDKIINEVGEEKFKPEANINSKLRSSYTNIYTAQKNTHGGPLSGEVKLAITLRWLAGGSYLDLALIFHCHPNWVTTICFQVLESWICNNAILPILNESYFKDVVKMRETAEAFRINGRHNGMFSGIIGALDGWLVRIRRPRISHSLPNISGFFSRKGFYALNVQVIVDRYKRVLWRSITSKGGEHDSTAFKNTSLYKQLIEDSMFLAEKGFYILGDSAYQLMSFLLTPFDGVQPYSSQDNFNFFHSSNRIFVECAFGEIDGRWGIFWKPLPYSLEKNIRIIDAAFRLHNFIVDCRLSRDTTHGLLNYNDDGEREQLDREMASFIRTMESFDDLDIAHYFFGIHGDNQPVALPVGRPTEIVSASMSLGNNIRNELCARFNQNGMTRSDRYCELPSFYRDQFHRVRERNQ